MYNKLIKRPCDKLIKRDIKFLYPVLFIILTERIIDTNKYGKTNKETS